MSAAPRAEHADLPRPAPDAARPLLMAAGGSVLLASAPVDTIDCDRSDSVDWADGVLAALRGGGPGAPVALGALSFRPDEPARMLRPQHASWVPQDAIAAVLGGPGPGPSELSMVEAPSRGRYADAVALAVERIAADPALHKVVLGRWLDILAEPAIDGAALVAELARRHPGQFLFSIPVTEDALLLGASPELLISRRGPRIRSVPLAGSIPRSADPVEDRARADGLLASAKDLEEHGYVVQAIAEALAPWCRELDVPGTPIALSTDTMWHLASPITGLLADGADSRLSALHLAQLLHPTPAVCGLPRDRAYRLIEELEPEGRGYLTGAVGWVDAAGDGDWAVTIRAGILEGASLRLFAGAGIVIGSDPQSEVRETQGKLETMLRAAGR